MAASFIKGPEGSYTQVPNLYSQGGTLSLLFPDFHSGKLRLLPNVLLSKWSLMPFGIHRKHAACCGTCQTPA